jgi:hypothetical protein
MLKENIRKYLIKEVFDMSKVDIDKEKMMMFRLWDKLTKEGKEIFYNKGFFDSIGISKWLYNKWVLEWLGEEKVFEQAITELKKFNGQRQVDDCGSFRFNYKIDIDSFHTVVDRGNPEIYFNATLFNEDSYVYIFPTDEEMDVKSAIEDEDRGWEVKIEAQDCIKNDLTNEIGEIIGVELYVDRLDIE